MTIAADGVDGVRLIRACGHADYADAGTDIVCAAISALMQVASIALEKRGGSVRIRRKPAEVEVSLAKAMNCAERNAALAILGAVSDGLRAIRESYPNNISIREV